jgi:glycosyltransferase 2 family protein
MKNVIRFLLIVLVAYYIFSGIDYSKLLLSFSDYTLFSLLFIVVIALIPEFIFAYRWTKVANERYGVVDALKAHTIVGLLSFVMPMKLGELAAIWYFSKECGVRAHKTIATTLIVRISDVLILLLLIVFSVGIVLEKYKLYAYLSLVILVVSIYIVYSRPRYVYFLCKLLPLTSVRLFAIRSVRAIHSSIHNHGFMNTMLLTILQWIAYLTVTAYFLVYVANFELSYNQIVMIFIVSTIGMAVPLAPSGFVTFHAAMILSLGWYGIPKEAALSSAITLHAILLSPSIIMYLVFMASGNKINLSWNYEK